MECSLCYTYFQALNSFLEWVLRDVSGFPLVIHYLDDCLCISPSQKNVCSMLLHTIERVTGIWGEEGVSGLGHVVLGIDVRVCGWWNGWRGGWPGI